MPALRNRGFTLIELMITVVIIAILAAIAIPSYRDYVVRGNITEATAELGARRVKSEQYFQDNRTYADSGKLTNPACVATTALKYFEISCTDVAVGTYKIWAKGKGSMAAFQYTIDQNGTKATEKVDTALGWIIPEASCGWVIKKDGSC